MIGPTAGESWLAYIGVPDDYPRVNELAREIDDAMWEAASEVLELRKLEDPVLRVMSDERCALWTWATVPAGTLPLGTGIAATYGRSQVHFGRLCEPRQFDREWYPDRLGVEWGRWTGDGGRWDCRPEITAHTEVGARVPVPFDLSALLAEIEQETGVRRRPKVPRRTRARKPTAGQWSVLDRAARVGGLVTEPRGRGATRRLPSLRRNGWVDDHGYLTPTGRTVAAAWTYDYATGELRPATGGERV